MFATLVAAYEKGPLLILEPFKSETATVPNPILHLTCLDASISIEVVFERSSSIVITSGTISSLGICPIMLRFNTVIQEPYSTTLTPRSFLPRIVTRSSNQVAVSAQVHASRSEMLQVASEITGVF